MKNNIGVIGLSVMGKNLAFNFADNGYKVSIFNRTVAVVDTVKKEYSGENIYPTYSLKEFVDSLEKPRRVFIMVKSGQPVDSMIQQLLDYVEEGDIIIDGGNSYFKDTIRRTKELSERGINFIGAGISGGEEGARFGPAIMPGGKKEAYDYVSEMFERISAKAYGEPCCRYISENGAGHYVKMVHNGIEYADMQLISEAYWILKNFGGMDNKEIQEVFKAWNKSELESYLIEITSNILGEKDGDDYLLDKILDKASQKGTGKWTNLEAINLGVDISVITSALNARFMSNLKDERTIGEKLFGESLGIYNGQFKNIDTSSIDRELLVRLVKNSLYISKIVAYAQGFKLLLSAQKEYGWKLNFSEIAKIFRGGCIIRARFLNDISDAFLKDGDIDNLIFTDIFSEEIRERMDDFRDLMSRVVALGIPANAMNSALGYIYSYSNGNSSANLIQAQRDYFGAHTFERIDKEGVYHNEWNNEN